MQGGKSTRTDEPFRWLFENAPYGLLIVDQQGTIVLVNGEAERIFGFDRDELTGAALAAVVPAEVSDHPWYRSGGTLERCARRKDGSGFMIEAAASELDTANGPLVSVAVKDVTQRKLAIDVLAHRATHDQLTGLPNRALLGDRLTQALARARRSAGKLAVVFVDLDGFKTINDSYGHEIGDQLLAATAQRLRAVLRPPDTVARLGGDEFVVVCEGLAGERDAASIALRMVDACGDPVLVGEQPLQVTISAGLVVVHDPWAATPASVLRDADVAMYRAKAAGCGCLEVFREATPAAVRRGRGN